MGKSLCLTDNINKQVYLQNIEITCTYFQPPFVVSLEDLELVHFERVQFQLKNFDMVFIFKDYNRKTQIVGSIPMNMLDNVKDWLNSVDIRYNLDFNFYQLV